jgi:hypothetical protein
MGRLLQFVIEVPDRTRRPPEELRVLRFLTPVERYAKSWCAYRKHLWEQRNQQRGNESAEPSQ